MIVLLYVSARFVYEVAGAIGAVVPIALFVIAEVTLVKLIGRQPLKPLPPA
jgi:hypothetical protein